MQVTVKIKEPEAEIITRLKKSFHTLDRLTFDVALGDINSLIVYGPAGCGKTFNVNTSLRAHQMFNRNKGVQTQWSRRSGHITPLALYQLLYEHRHKGTTLMLDDIDAVFKNNNSLNLLKAAVDSNGKREVSYMSSTPRLAAAGIPTSFEYEGGVIIITNTNVHDIKGERQKHLQALVSRSHYMDLNIDTDEEMFVWLRHVTLEANMLRAGGITDAQAQEIITFVEVNMERMNELTLRMVSKVAALMQTHPKEWKDFAEITLMKRTG